MKLVKRFISVLALLTLAACGSGDNGAGEPPFGGPDGGGGNGGGGGGTSTPATASDLVLTLSAKSVSNSGAESVVATATALDANRNTLTGVPITISVNNGGIATASGAATDEDGIVTANVSIGSDRSNRTITVTATSGGLVRTAELQVADSGGEVATPSDLVLQLSSSSIPSSGATPVTATVTALDARRNVLPGAGVVITVDSGATAQVSGPITDDSGLITALIGTGGDATNRTINVTATSGSITRTAALQVSNAPTTNGPVAADLSLTLSASQLDNAGTNTIRATATAVDSNRNVLAGIPVTIQVDASAQAAVSGRITNAAGIVTADVGIGADRSNRAVTVTATSGALTRAASFVVTGAKITASFAPRVDAGSTANEIKYTLVDTNAAPMANVAYTVSGSNGTSQVGVTDVNGKFAYRYNAPAAAGQIEIVAIAAGTDSRSSITVASTQFPNVAANLQILSASVAPTPSVVATNATAEGTNQVELRGLFVGRDTNVPGQTNVPIPNARAKFEILNNTDGSLGRIEQIGTYAYSDAAGVARAIFRPGPRSSPTNGVQIQLCWGRSNAEADACANPTRATLTVVEESLSVNIRTNELIKEGAAKLTYIKEYVVMVVDAAGQAKADVQITPSIDLTGNYKGFYTWDDALSQWVQTITLAADQKYRWDSTLLAWRLNTSASARIVCPNEDVNRNGVREAAVFNASGAVPALADRGEDMNWNGDLDPRKADVAVKMVGSSKTDANGLAIVQIEYGKDLATWVDFVITVTASGVLGTEVRAKYPGTLPASADAITTETPPPAFVVSPYGTRSTCIDPD
jgi:hypothetical protein